MRLWHQDLINKLPRQQLLGQHRECSALRGKGWGRKHSTIDYVFTHIPERLVAYHFCVMDEMRIRGYNPDPIWYDANYRGKILGYKDDWCDKDIVEIWYQQEKIYPEHNTYYLEECLKNLAEKGVYINV